MTNPFSGISNATAHGAALLALGQGVVDAPYPHFGLHVPAGNPDGDTVTIGGVTFEGANFVDNGLTTTGGQWNNTTEVLAISATGHGLSAGALLEIQDGAPAWEMAEVLEVIDANTIRVKRGVQGSTIAATGDGVAIHETPAVSAGNVTVGLSTSGVADVTNWSSRIVSYLNLPLSGMQRAADKMTMYLTSPVVNPPAVSGTIASGDVTDWRDLTDYSLTPMKVLSRRVTALEVATGFVEVYVPFEPRNVLADFRHYFTGAALAWDGAIAWSSVAGGLYAITLSNAGAVDFDADDNVNLIIFGAPVSVKNAAGPA